MVDCGDVEVGVKDSFRLTLTRFEKENSPSYLQMILRTYLKEIEVLSRKIHQPNCSEDNKRERQRAKLKCLVTRCVPYVISLFQEKHQAIIDSDLLAGLRGFGVAI